MNFFTAKNIGCFRDTGRRAISPLEGRSRLLKGSYRRRKYAIRKCALAAQKRGFRVFAVQHGGWCAASRTGHLTYSRYGRSNRCRNGKGGPWANDVYVLKGQRKHYLRLLSHATLKILVVLNRRVHFGSRNYFVTLFCLYHSISETFTFLSFMHINKKVEESRRPICNNSFIHAGHFDAFFVLFLTNAAINFLNVSKNEPMKYFRESGI